MDKERRGSSFKRLAFFISERMRMSHVYQPVMLIELLRRGGSASVTQIAEALRKYDDAQLEYYEKVTKNMVGRVLTNKRNQIAVREKNSYFLNGFDDLQDSEITMLKDLCMVKIKNFVEKRGETIWNYRKKSSGYVPGSLRYEILKAARFKCMLCGISADEKHLHVDHIVPRNKGGGDERSNLQALCYSCNSMKRDKDDTDLELVVKSYSQRSEGCIFCDVSEMVEENELAFAIRDKYPVTDKHTLIIPKRHVSDYFDLYQPERNAIQQLLESQRAKISSKDTHVTGFNIGNNVGEDAGQTVFHCHTHLIPRRKGDMLDPRGGVRGVIPGQQKY